MDLSLEQLRELVVVTVSREEERLDRAAASVYVISAEDIRRSGAASIPEALRLAPALNVARADSSQYAISGRGFNNVLANKMLVLIDGRTVYTPLFSGVFWEAQDVVMEDVERIEVVTGPSTALWGSNAVNGLIHVITRSAAGTQGVLAAARLGDRERGATVRYGGRLIGDGHFRVYAKAYDRSETHRADGTSVKDQADGVQAGFRADWTHERETVTLQGDVNEGRVDQTPAARHFTGANLLARWDRRLDDNSTASAQLTLERTRRDHPQTFRETLDAADLVAQYGMAPMENHHLLVGLGYRRAQDHLDSFAALGFLPPSRGLSWSRVFVRDHLTLPGRWTMTLATSVERNPYTGTEVLPSVRLALQPDDGSLWWGGISRAVRAPSRVDREFVQPAQPPYLLAGGPNFRAEVSNVFELGHRAQPIASLSYSVTLFHHEHSKLRSLEPTPIGLQFENGIAGRTTGLEAWARWRVTDRWRLDTGGSWMRQALHVQPGAAAVGGTTSLGNDPHGWWSLRSSLDISPGVGWDLSLRRVGSLPSPAVPAYTAVDTRVAWQLSRQAEVALNVQNLLDPDHPEWGVATNRVSLERSVMLQLSWRPR